MIYNDFEWVNCHTKLKSDEIKNTTIAILDIISIINDRKFIKSKAYEQTVKIY